MSEKIVRCSRCNKPIAYGNPFVYAKPRFDLQLDGQQIGYFMRELRFCNDFCMKMYFGIRNVPSLKEVEEEADDDEEIEQGYDLPYGD